MISICIPSRGPLVGVWATIAACESWLGDKQREYCVYRNGTSEPFNIEPQSILQDNTSLPLSMRWSTDPVPPPIARNRAAEMARGRVLYFLDDHCLPQFGYFDFAPSEGNIVHAAYSANFGQYFYHHSLLNRECPTRADYSRTRKMAVKYRIRSGCSGAFAIRHSDWKRIGGQDDFWQGFGGEEVYFDLKAQMLGMNVWMEPRMKVFHFSCRSPIRGYSKDFNEWNFSEGFLRLKAGFPNQSHSLDEILDQNEDWL